MLGTTGEPTGQVLHGCAWTTVAVRRAIQSSQECLIILAARYDINPKTVRKWRKCSFVKDAPMGPKPCSTTLSDEQEAIIVAFRKQTLLPLDDVTAPCRLPGHYPPTLSLGPALLLLAPRHQPVVSS